VTPTIPLWRKLLYSVVTVLSVLLFAGGVLLAIDVYLHHRVQNLGAVNVYGYRGPTVPAKRAGEVRIVVLGGSTAFGYGLPYDEAFPYYLQEALNGRAAAGRRYRVINLGAPAQGAYGFLFDLEDYASLGYDVAIFYEGYNDLGARDLPNAVPARDGPNYLLWRRQSPVFRMTGYFPVLPLVFREKAMALRSGGNLDAAYRGRVVFKPGLATRATAATLSAAAAVADAVGAQLGKLSADAVSAVGDGGPLESWTHYTGSVLRAVDYARARGVKVVVVTQPYASDTHVRQQQALKRALDEHCGGDRGVRYVNLGTLVDLRDRALAYDGLHLVARGNAMVAQSLVDPVLALAP
jgi:hypothetical protein